ncbi:glycoside hydrolase family 15 [Pseudactinotalea sp.]|uniref:glycoside hydrolase family 15 n=1 Tax=Pseudactinotalea sp. TaxID=1926260 RepID=UPI003B3AF9EE
MRRRIWSRAILAVAVVVLVTGAALFERPRRDEPGSYADGVALDSEGRPQLLPAGSAPDLLPGSRVLDPGSTAAAPAIAAALALAQDQRDWLASGWLPEGEYRSLVATALLDLRVLSTDGGTLAAMNASWRYVWPRDASFAAVAFAATGHVDDAVAVLEYLQHVQAADGSFEARYLPDGSGPPDDRHPQTDGAGWALWALDAVVAAAPADQQSAVLAGLDPLLRRSTAFLLDQVNNSRALPAPSSDYWEHREHLLTLGTAAPVLAGLEASARIHDRAGEADRTEHVATVAAKVRDAVEIYFGPHDYGRYPGPSHPDAASAFLLPPYQPTPLTGAVEAWQGSVDSMLRPAGGLAPGGGWKEQNLSWTPETALYALAAASIDDDETARHWLDWLAAHRTPIGALPEKVAADGGPSGPAPLAWTCALVVLTVVELEA